MAAMDRIYQDSEDVYVSATMIYANDSKAYKDSTFANQYTTSELKNVFLKGAVIQLDTDSYAIPVGYSESSSIGSVAYVYDNSGATIGTLAAVADPA